jgi:hypothetical protein
MSSRGRSLAVSPFRRLVVDLMYFSQGTPAVAIDRRMNLAALQQARQRAVPKPPWSVVFAKAFALVGKEHSELRRCYMKSPWPRFYEHPYSMVSLNIEREFHGEQVVVQVLIRRPENRSLAELDAIIRLNQTTPLEKLRWYERAMAMSRVPGPLRRLLWWGALNVLGRRRCHNFGTFSVTSVASHGAGVLHVVPLLAFNLHYGLFDAQGNLDVRLTFDHRVLDGVSGARLLVEVEKTLNGAIIEELQRTSSERGLLESAQIEAA